MNIRKLAIYTTFCLGFITGCDSSESNETDPVPVKTKVVTKILNAEDIYSTRVFPARVSAVKTAQIRPQVGGIIQKRLFRQGSEILQGQPLFQIDAAPFEADVEMANAAVAKAKATYQQMSKRASRFAQLQKSAAISQQDLEDAKASSAQAAADLAEATASLNRKRLDLNYATVKAPISGRIDQEFITEGALVSPGDTQAMAVIQQLDRVYVDARVPAQELRTIYQTVETDPASQSGAVADVLDDKGQSYETAARLLFSGISVNDETGDVVLRAEAENPQRILLPGMFVKLKITRLIQKEGLVVPEQALSRADDKTTVWIVGHENKARRVEIQTGEQTEKGITVTAGLKAGDKIVIEGQDKLQDGAEVIAQSDVIKN
ncbi:MULTISPECIES: efflux RND transporter periplasmic adaptor subunit [unclassified Enterobacter]|uniref:efflux RND transporter periplasmic adaptor subunit n=1 Tax=unclassified Enterobacter TaxID=2608935 RepID=UPI00296E45EF|nr:MULTISPECIES: efflux RND transporter periplasmic adaptor subunit [unclassified Enterobacter]WJD49415.1 efflux RND transporter periplasmic adaptor subunit [Enterobacter sp. PGRG2]